MTSGKGGGNPYESDALVQAIPYEQVRNNLLTAFNLSSDSDAIQLLDANASTFGALVQGQGRNLSLSIIRMSTWARICDLAVAEGMDNILQELFDPAAPLAPDTICQRILGRPLFDHHYTAVEKLLSLEGYENQVQKQHAIGFACCAMLENQVQ